ncbi:MAG: hypothetical protein JO188_07960 [Hyphomicrobiales bacterium]|nr:hypothetical protein [Hyphomicrobiales bacterium]
MQPPHTPSTEDRAAIKAEFKLDPVSEVRLWQVVDRVIEESERHAEFEKHQPSRKTRLRALRNLQRDVERLRNTFEASAPDLSDLLRRTAYPDLGGFFTAGSMSEIAQQMVGPDLQFSQLERIVKARSGRFNCAEIDRETEEGRREAGKTIGPRLLNAVLTTISKPVSAQLELERAHPGGREQLLYRNYLIQELGRSYSEIFGKSPTTTKDGHFVQLCEWVLSAVGIDSRGVENAVSRVLERADLIAGSPKKKNK